MRTRYIQDPDTGKLIPFDEYYSEPVAPMVMPDIEPYQSMADGTIIASRSQHRAHLKRHNCIEIGNETSYLLKEPKRPDVDPKGRKELIIAQIQALGHDGFKKAMKRDIDNIKWNSNTK